MSGQRDQMWTLGGLSYAGGHWVVTTAGELSSERAEVLRQETLFVSRLAERRDFHRLIDAVARWERTVEQAKAVLASGHEHSSESRRTIMLDLVAVARAADRLERVLVEDVAAATNAPAEAARIFNEVRHRIRAMPNYLLTHEAARRAVEDGVELVLVDGLVHMGETRSLDARNMVVGLVGSFHWLVAAHVAVYEEKLEAIAMDIESAAAAIEEGTPHLVSYETDAEGHRSGPISFIQLPLGEIDALRRFFHESRAASGAEDAVGAAMRLTRASSRARLTVAGVDVTAGMLVSSASTGVNELPASRIELDLDLLGSTPVEYWGAVRYSLMQDDLDHEMFAGAVQQAAVQDGSVSLTCEGAVELTEHNARGLVAANVSSGELFRSIAIQAGLPSDIIPISEEAGPQAGEDFEVLVPILGIEVSEPLAVGSIEVVPQHRGEPALEGLDIESDIAVELVREFRDAASYGSAKITATALHEAEDAGWAAVRVAMAWLVVRERYGLARLPDGRAQPFSRQEAVRAPRIGDVVLVRGETTGRKWLRSRGARVPLDRTLTADSTVLTPELPPDLGPAERQALLSLHRASSETIVESQLQVLWEAIEFYVTRTRVPPLFTDAELDRLRTSIPEDLDAAQADALTEAIGGLNGAPLLVRLELRLKEDGVPLADEERKLLFEKLRRARNKTAHGRAIRNPPTREELHRGIALVARMLVYKIAKASG